MLRKIRKKSYFCRKDTSGGSQSSGFDPSKNSGFSVTTIGDMFDKAVDKTLNDQGFMNWASNAKK